MPALKREARDLGNVRARERFAAGEAQFADKARGGKEAAQVYVREVTKEVYRPYKELKAVKKVFVKAHGSTEAELTLDERAFAYYSVAKDKWTVKPGVFEIMVGRNVEEIELRQKIRL